MAPIHEALRQHDVEALRRELERGVDPDLRDPANGNRTPLQLLPLRRLPPEVLRKIAAFAFHAGFY